MSHISANAIQRIDYWAFSMVFLARGPTKTGFWVWFTRNSSLSVFWMSDRLRTKQLNMIEAPKKQSIFLMIQWNPSILDSTGNNRIVQFRGRSGLQRLGNGVKFLFGNKNFVRYIKNSSILRIRYRGVPLYSFIFISFVHGRLTRISNVSYCHQTFHNICASCQPGTPGNYAAHNFQNISFVAVIC